MYACTVADKKNKPRLEEFFNNVKTHDWRSLNSFSDWKGDKNNMEAFVVRCASGGVMFVLRNPYELYETDELYLLENISSAEMAEVERLVPSTSWHPGPSVLA